MLIENSNESLDVIHILHINTLWRKIRSVQEGVKMY